ncbi:MAG: AAA family ATPase [Planctomycetes bacterium]|nr:AAA family ATPase [Planctomycetota bacterium]
MANEPKIISVHSGKGGVGKTTIVANLGAELAARGAFTVLIDSDFFTRGLTFLLSKDKLESKVGYIDLVQELCAEHEQSKAGNTANVPGDVERFHKVASKLFLVPPTCRREGFTGEYKEYSLDSDPVSKHLSDMAFVSADAFRKCFHGLQYVLIDCRSGTDQAAIAPAFVADEYWVVTEEDNTSIRATNFLLESIQYRVLSVPGRENDPQFGGFIVNMIVSARPQFLVKSLERIFGGPCLAVAPLSRRAREAFIHDRLVSKSRPHDPVSREIRALANGIPEGFTESAADRLARLDRIDRLRRLSLGAVAAFTPVIAGSLIFVREFSEWLSLPGRTISMIVVLLGAAAGVGLAALYLRR